MNPLKLIIIDFSEYNLYKIYEELKELNNNQTFLEAKLINAENQFKLQEIFKEHNIKII